MKKTVPPSHVLTIADTSNAVPLTVRHNVRFQQLLQKYSGTWRELYAKHGFNIAKYRMSNLDTPILISGLEVIIKLNAVGFTPEKNVVAFYGKNLKGLEVFKRYSGAALHTCLKLYIKCYILTLMGCREPAILNYVNEVENNEVSGPRITKELYTRASNASAQCLSLSADAVIPWGCPDTASITISYLMAIVEKWLSAETVDLMLLFNSVLPWGICQQYKDKLVLLNLLDDELAKPNREPDFMATIPVVVKGVVSVSRSRGKLIHDVKWKEAKPEANEVAVPAEMASLSLPVLSNPRNIQSISERVAEAVAKEVNAEGARRVKNFEDLAHAKEKELKDKVSSMTPEQRAEILKMAELLKKG